MMIATKTQQREAKGKALVLGLLVATLMAACLLLTAKPAHAAAFTVNSTGDLGDQTPGDGSCFTGIVILPVGTECTLRAAIGETNANNNDSTVVDEINFGIPGAGPHTISPASNLPFITEPVVIDGYTQSGTAENTETQPGKTNAVLKIQLRGPGIGIGLLLDFGVSDCVIRGLAISNFGDGILLNESGSNNRIEGNFLGTDPSGTTAGEGNAHGVELTNTDDSTLGGTSPEARNLISGNDSFGVLLEGGSSGNAIQGNLIGTDASGSQDLGNGGVGVLLIDNSSGNTIGGTKAGARNVISGNDAFGVFIFGATNKVMGNYIGTDASGSQDLGNSLDGVLIDDVPDNVIGGTTTGARNVISGNDGSGVKVLNPGATGNKVMGNRIGPTPPAPNPSATRTACSSAARRTTPSGAR